eukprot:CAMPEP_0179140458 /NCGR_PEP_ID=MMETSP0796-20121207/67255_1 /TAXON_ID=73915 /ORGANISM="Pyrodinium bahamense, Strain pbaha01" /LENGTH=108 /DNA_ID=CAMNT_0020839999 /DNA_START=180 /DNA_END=506 /DNA_ORIENTATION=+
MPTRPTLVGTPLVEERADGFDWRDVLPWWGWTLLAILLAVTSVAVCEARARWHHPRTYIADIEACSHPEDGEAEVPFIEAELPALLLSNSRSLPMAEKPKLGRAPASD